MNKATISFLILFCGTCHAGREPCDRDLRIINGSPARPAQFPHAVALTLHLKSESSGLIASFCGGSIIHPSYVLTAAHCLDDATRVEIAAGIHQINRGHPQFRVIVQARDFRQHQQYKRDTLINDIALIFILRRIPFNHRIQAIALPPRSHENNRFVGRIGTVIGWGWFSDASSTLSDELRYAESPILPDKDCTDLYNGHYRYFNPTNICFSGKKSSTCNGDSGGGVHMLINGRITLIGIVSFGYEKCEEGFPTGMTRVTSYLDWISANTGLRMH